MTMKQGDDDQNQEPSSYFLPVIPRLDRLDRILKVLEEKHGSSRKLGFSSNHCGENEACKLTLSSAVEEVQSKGTLMDRLAYLENRVLQLSLEIEEGNSSKSSSSVTVEVSETTGKDSDELSFPITTTRQHEKQQQVVACQDMQTSDSPVLNVKEEASSVDGPLTKRTLQHKSGGHKRKYKRKWLGLFQFPLSC